MNRMEELRAIEEHIEQRGIYRCRMGESHYGDNGVPYRQFQVNKAKSRTPRQTKYVRLTCKQCDKAFEVTPARAKENPKYCSQNCRRSGMSKGKHVPCAECGTVHYRRPAVIREPEKMFCSASCAAKARNRAVLRKGQNVPCAVCGTVVYRAQSDLKRAKRITCSRRCRVEVLRK